MTIHSLWTSLRSRISRSRGHQTSTEEVAATETTAAASTPSTFRVLEGSSVEPISTSTSTRQQTISAGLRRHFRGLFGRASERSNLSTNQSKGERKAVRTASSSSRQRTSRRSVRGRSEKAPANARRGKTARPRGLRRTLRPIVEEPEDESDAMLRGEKMVDAAPTTTRSFAEFMNSRNRRWLAYLDTA